MAPPSLEAPRASALSPHPRSPVFPGWRWAAVALAFPVAGLVGRAAGGEVDAVGAALIGGAFTGAVLGVAQWLAARDMFGQWPVWIGASAIGYGVGLAAGAALVDYETDLGSLAAMGAVSGAVLGLGQGFALAAQDRERLAVAWGVAMPALLAAGWSVTTLGGIDVDKQWTVFGAFGAVTFMVLSGLLLARFINERETTDGP